MRESRRPASVLRALPLALGLIALVGCTVSPAPGAAPSTTTAPPGGGVAPTRPATSPTPAQPTEGASVDGEDAAGSTPEAAVAETCDALFSTVQRDQLASLGLELQNDLVVGNPKFEAAPELPLPELVTLAADRLALACTWAPPQPGHTFIHTALMTALTPDEAAFVPQRLTAAGYACAEELGGIRCTAELDGMYDAGYSSFVRDDVWLLTFWSSLAPQDYTSQIVEHLWAAA